MGYAIYRHDVMEWKIFPQQRHRLSHSLPHLDRRFRGSDCRHQESFPLFRPLDLVYVAAMAITFLFFYATRERVQNFLTLFLQQQFIRNRRAIRDLSFEILTLREVGAIRRTIVKKMSDLFQLKQCDIRPAQRADIQEEPHMIAENEELWAQGFRFSVPSPQHPGRPGFSLARRRYELFTGEEGELLTILGNHIALALDNAAAYRKIRDFSNSLEKLVDERTKALIQSESLAAVGRLAAGVAHELNNPIASVMSTLEYQIDHLDQNEEIREDMVFALGELKRVRDIVRSLLDASRQKEEMKEGVDIHRLSKTLSGYFTVNTRQEDYDRYRFEGFLPDCEGNQSRLCQCT